MKVPAGPRTFCHGALARPTRITRLLALLLWALARLLLPSAVVAPRWPACVTILMPSGCAPLARPSCRAVVEAM
eukprot:5395903-Pyramimonas_sp.AAC.1